MLDINLFRIDRGGDPEVFKLSQRRRFADESLVDLVVQHDTKCRQLLYDEEQLNKQLNSISKHVASLKKAKQQTSSEEVAQLLVQSKAIKARIAEAKAQGEEVQRHRDAALEAIGNIVDDSVPISKDEVDNQVLRELGARRPREPWMCSHPDLLDKTGLANLEAGQAVAGSRGYYLLGQGVLLNQALVNYALQFLVARGFQAVQTPFFMTRDIMAECAQLSQFDEELYRISLDSEGGSSILDGGSGAGGVSGQGGISTGASTGASSSSSSSSGDKYLIATSEQPLCALHRKSWLEPGELPLKYAGFSTCFRREVGSHGRDTLGLFRVHQFEKVEQFCITSPHGDTSSKALDEMVGHCEDFYSSLGIPYRLVSIVSGALNKAAVKKYDLEGWFPASQAYRELVSSSNCTDYQARRLDVRLRQQKGAGGEQAQPALGGAFVHMLNSTLTATQRTMSCIMENHQTQEGIVVPQPLRPFMGGTDFIPFKQGLAQAAGMSSRMLRAVPK